MAPRLRVLISTPEKAYPPSKPLGVNSPAPTQLKTPGFDGEVNAWVKDFSGEKKEGEGDEYFDSEGRGGMTYAIVVRGRFLHDLDADELVFGNVFERPIKDRLPWGSSIAIKAMHFVDPNVQLDIYGDKPWALSPTLATFNYLSLSKDKPEYRPSVEEDSLDRLEEMYDGDFPPPSSAESSTPAEHKAARKKWLGNAEHRKGVKVDKSTWVGMEFCNGYLDFNTLSAKLPPPFNLSFPLLQYWDGQPVTYVCKKSAPAGSKDQTEGEVFFAVAFEIIDEEAKKMLAEKEGGQDNKDKQKDKNTNKEKNGDSDDDDDSSDEEEGEFEDAQQGSDDDID